MTKWKITYEKKVYKDFLRFNNTTQKRITSAINEKLTTHPDIYGKPLKHKLSDYWRLRVGDYRVIYKIMPDDTIIIVTAIDHRKDSYN